MAPPTQKGNRCYRQYKSVVKCRFCPWIRDVKMVRCGAFPWQHWRYSDGYKKWGFDMAFAFDRNPRSNVVHQAVSLLRVCKGQRSYGKFRCDTVNWRWSMHWELMAAALADTTSFTTVWRSWDCAWPINLLAQTSRRQVRPKVPYPNDKALAQQTVARSCIRNSVQGNDLSADESNSKYLSVRLQADDVDLKIGNTVWGTWARMQTDAQQIIKSAGA